MFINILKKQTGLNKTLFLNFTGTFILQGINLITIPIFTRVLGTEQYGLYAVFSSWTAIISTIMAFGINNCINSGKYYFKDEYYSFRNNIIIFSIIFSILFCLLCVLLFKLINSVIGYNFNTYIVLLLTSLSTNFIGMLSGILTYEKKAILNFAISIFISLSNVLLSLFFVFYIELPEIYLGRVYGHFIAYFSVTIIFILVLLLNKKIVLNKKYLFYGLSVGFPIIFHTLSNYVLSQSDRLMMQKMNIHNSEIGIYSLFYSFCGVLMVILSAFNSSFAPFYFDYIDQDDRENMVDKSKNYIELFTVVCIGFLLLSREVSYLMANKEYYSGINLIPIFVGSTYFIFMYQFSVNYEFFYRKTKTIAMGTISAAIINIILNFYFINKLGMYGAAYATIISYFMLFLFHYIIVKSMKQNRFYIKISDYLFGCIFLTIGILSFCFLDKFIYLRWTIGFLLGIYEIFKITNRRSIF